MRYTCIQMTYLKISCLSRSQKRTEIWNYCGRLNSISMWTKRFGVTQVLATLICNFKYLHLLFFPHFLKAQKAYLVLLTTLNISLIWRTRKFSQNIFHLHKTLILILDGYHSERLCISKRNMLEYSRNELSLYSNVNYYHLPVSSPPPSYILDSLFCGNTFVTSTTLHHPFENTL